MDAYDELNTIHVANRFIKEISDGWGEETETQDIVRLVELLTPIETALRELQGEVNEQARLLGMGSEREARLMAERDALKKEVLQALSFGFSTACVLLDKGEDPRHYELPRLLDEWKAAREE